MTKGRPPSQNDGVTIDRVEKVVGNDGDELAGFEPGASHPLRGDLNAEPGFGAGDRPVAGGHLHSAFAAIELTPPERFKTLALSSGQTRLTAQSRREGSEGNAGLTLLVKSGSNTRTS